MSQPARLDAAEVFECLASPGADPRPLQLVVWLPVLIDVSFRAAHSEAVSAVAWAGYAVLAAATLASWLIAGRRSARGTWLLPVADIVALTLLQGAGGYSIAIALAFPAIWLGLRWRWRGAGAAVGATLLSGVASGADAQAAQVLVMVGLGAGALALAARHVDCQRERMEGSREQMDRAVADLQVIKRVQEAVVRGVDEALVLLDRKGNYLLMNSRRQEVLALAYPNGVSGDAAHVGQVFAADGMTRLDREALPTSRATRGEEFTDDLVWVGPDPERRRALLSSARVLHDDDGNPDGAVLAYHDVTDLMEALRVKEDFVASVSHELRTPLTCIVGYLDLVLEDVESVPDEARELLSVAARNSSRLVRMVSDLLETAQQDPGFGMVSEPVDLETVVARTVADAMASAQEGGIALACRIDAHARVYGDQNRLTQVIDNLLSNALKYTRRGDNVEVRVGVQAGDAAVVVRDSGMGVQPDETAQLFQRFFRTEEAKRLGIPGVGLGLTISKEIVEAHGGTITVRSRPGQGSTFSVHLPLAGRLRAVS